MRLTRRRFLTISAAALGTAGAAQAGSHQIEWHGQALGAECQITLRAPKAQATAALQAARAVISEVEAQFSLYDPESTLSRLNRTGKLIDPDPRFLALLDLSDRLHGLTGGVFDPSIQPLWQALAKGDDPSAARKLVGWERFTWDRKKVILAPGQALSFNGIAQGYATDRVAEALRDHGLGDMLVNIGEFSGHGGPWRLGITDPDQGLVGTRTLRNGALATSSPRAMILPGGATHIFDPKGKTAPKWSTVSVEAESATVADALSTAICLMERADAKALRKRAPDVRRITLIGFDGDLVTL